MDGKSWRLSGLKASMFPERQKNGRNLIKRSKRDGIDIKQKRSVTFTRERRRGSPLRTRFTKPSKNTGEGEGERRREKESSTAKQKRKIKSWPSVFVNALRRPDG